MVLLGVLDKGAPARGARGSVRVVVGTGREVPAAIVAPQPLRLPRLPRRGSGPRSPGSSPRAPSELTVSPFAVVSPFPRSSDVEILVVCVFDNGARGGRSRPDRSRRNMSTSTMLATRCEGAMHERVPAASPPVDDDDDEDGAEDRRRRRSTAECAPDGDASRPARRRRYPALADVQPGPLQAPRRRARVLRRGHHERFSRRELGRPGPARRRRVPPRVPAKEPRREPPRRPTQTPVPRARAPRVVTPPNGRAAGRGPTTTSVASPTARER